MKTPDNALFVNDQNHYSRGFHLYARDKDKVHTHSHDIVKGTRKHKREVHYSPQHHTRGCPRPYCLHKYVHIFHLLLHSGVTLQYISDWSK